MKRFWIVMMLAACGGDDGGGTTGDLDGGNTGDGGPTGDGDPGTCTRWQGLPSGTRFMALGRPFAASGSQATKLEILKVDAAGVVSQFKPNGQIIDIGGRANYGSIQFTPDGNIGIVAMDNGKLGVFRLAADGTATVVHAGFAASFYATGVVMDPSGERAWVLNTQTRNNGGGVYAVKIACDGTLTDEGMVFAAKSPNGLVIDGNRALVTAADALDHASTTDDVHLLSWGTTPMYTAGADAFGTASPSFIVGGAAQTFDKATYLVGDNNVAGPNRVAAVTVGASTLTPNAVITGIIDPQSIVTSPFGNVALVTAVQGNKIHILDNGGPNATWRANGQPAYMGSNPQLPADMTTVTRGTLEGHVWVAENVSIRHLRFTQAGAVEDLGSLVFEAPNGSVENITGAIGITPVATSAASN